MSAEEIINEITNEKTDQNLTEYNIKQLWANVLSKKKGKKKYTILLPPPNITGSLHMGHFLNWSIQDLLMRYAYTNDLEPNWIPGLDHAGIGAQFIVERELYKEGITRNAIGKEAFIKKVWEWKKTAEESVTEQALKFGFFLNWENRIFTMDEDYQQHVTNAFVKLYNDGLISQSYRITNWDTKFQTALSDLEVIEKTEKRSIYIIQYKAKDFEQSGDFINIATTRPETLFADAAVCVHPDDDRFKHLHGKTFLIPIIDKAIPLILDSNCEMEKGTGALKVTPAHDARDNELGKRHNLEFIQVINKDGCMFNVPQRYINQPTAVARKMIIDELDKSGLLIETQPWEGIVYYAEKSDQPIETIITKQWFLDTSALAKLALEKSEKIEFLPENIRNTFKNWMNNIQPWCISRQIWWGHEIPIWYTKDGSIICAHNQEEAQKIAQTKDLIKETDVLDTWFSSALWPIATQESAQKSLNEISDPIINGQNIHYENHLNEDQASENQESAINYIKQKKQFEPTDMLVTGKDILFFWVARMIMFTLYFKNEIPFKRIYFNGIIRDKNRQKMSKTKGNTLNPIILAQEYPKDAIRFSVLKQASWGKDILIDIKEIETGRTLITKLNNCTKFITQFMKKEYKANSMLDNWMENKLAQAKINIAKSIDECAFHEACQQFYDLFWNNFCAWYIEGCKIFPSPRAQEFFASILKIGHPIIPWATEECFQMLPKNNTISILDYEFPALSQTHKIEQFEQIINISTMLRKVAVIGGCKEFMIANTNANNKNEANKNSDTIALVKWYTKLEISNELDFEFQMYDTKILITQESASKAKEAIKKELAQLKIDIDTLNERMQPAIGKHIPQKILEEWQIKLNNLNANANTLKNWIDSLI